MGFLGELGQFLAIVCFAVLAAITYGISHDMVTAHVCVEYFSVFHPRVIASEHPVALALVWGVLATWWVGLLLGVPLALVSRLGRRPRLGARHLLRPVAQLLGWTAVCAFAFGLMGYAGGLLRETLGTGDQLVPEGIPREKHVRFLADLTAHNAAYGFAGVGGIVLCVLTWIRRGRLEPGNYDEATALDP